MSRSKTVEELEIRAGRDALLVRNWGRAYQAARKAQSTSRAAQATATDEVARQAGLTPRRVQMILKSERVKIQRQSDLRERALRTSEPTVAVMTRARSMVTDEQWSLLRRMPATAGLPLLRLIVDGAAAIEENKKLRAQLIAWKGTYPDSAKRKSG